ncbi:centrosomal protein of 55 kDa [Osmerus mordax]|uniref:centrosomal protein of 55 kDa n=1 Tax=Osmerus mordax TaxID=8014 RepID=UPI0035109FA1
MEISKLKKENAFLRKSLDELARKKGEPSDSENNQLLLERIISLETLRERNSQQLLSKDEEIASLRRHLRLTGGETVAHLQAQIDHYHKEAEQRERLFQSLQAETEDIKNKLVAVSTKCQELEGKNVSNGQVCSSTAAVIHEHLRDALDKNQQWLAYDQQREAYVKAALARVFGLEQQLNQAKQALTQKHNEAHSDGESGTVGSGHPLLGHLHTLAIIVCQNMVLKTLEIVRKLVQAPFAPTIYNAMHPSERKLVQMQEHYEKLVLTAKREREAEREHVKTTQRELNDLQRRCEEKQREMEKAKQQLQEERLNSKRSIQEERRRSGDRESRLRAEEEELEARLEGEMRRSSELLLQVNLLQKSLLSQHEDQNKISVLEQQIQVFAKDLEDEKKDCQYLQKQLHKVLKELRKAKDHAAQLESEREQWESRPYKVAAHGRPSPSKLPRDTVISPSRPTNQLDESFLECPSCRTQYSTSEHRELLTHIDHCLG